MNVPSGTHSGSYTRTITDATKTESSAEKNSYTATAADGTLEKWGDAKQNTVTTTTHDTTLAYWWSDSKTVNIGGVETHTVDSASVTIGNHRKTIDDVAKERQQHKDGTETKSDENITRYDTSISATVSLEVARNVTDNSTPGVTIINNTNNKTHRTGTTGSISSSSIMAALNDVFTTAFGELTPDEAEASFDNVAELLGAPSINSFHASYTLYTGKDEYSSYSKYTGPDREYESSSSGWDEHTEKSIRYTKSYDLPGSLAALAGLLTPEGEETTVSDKSHHESKSSSTEGENWHQAEDTSDEERTTVVSVHFGFDFSAGGVTGSGTLTETHKYDVTSWYEGVWNGTYSESSSEYHGTSNATTERYADGSTLLVAYSANSHSQSDSMSSDGGSCGTSSHDVSTSNSALTGGVITSTYTSNGWSTSNCQTTPYSHSSTSTTPVIGGTWNTPTTTDFFGRVAQEAAQRLLDAAVFLVGNSIELATASLNFTEVYVSNSSPQYNGIYDWLGQNVILPWVGEERLLAGGRFGTGWADDLMIAGLLATEIVGYFDPTPVSDLLNAGLNAADGNYVDAGMSLAGMLIPGGADKGAKAAGNIGSNVMNGFGDSIKGLAKRIDCNDANPIFSTVGKALGQCFVGDTLVVLDFAPGYEPTLFVGGAQVAAEGNLGPFSGTNIVAAAGVSAVLIGVGGAVGLKRRRKREEIARRHAVDEVFGSPEEFRQIEPTLPEVSGDEFEQLCDRLFAGDDEWVVPSDRALDGTSDLNGGLQSEFAARVAVTALHSGQRLARSTAPVKSAATPPKQDARANASSLGAKQRSSWRAPLLWLLTWLTIGACCLGLTFSSKSDPSTATSVVAFGTESGGTTPAAPRYITQKIQDLPVARPRVES